jgi:CRP-like cAMP-binding protein
MSPSHVPSLVDGSLPYVLLPSGFARLLPCATYFDCLTVQQEYTRCLPLHYRISARTSGPQWLSRSMTIDYHAFFNAVSPVPRPVLERLLLAGREKGVARGEFITREGQVQRDLLLVEAGVQMAYLDHDGTSHVLAFTYPPSLSGVPDSFCLQQPSRYHLQALTPSRFRAIPYADVLALLDESQALERAFRKLTEHLLAGIMTRHVELRTLPIAERLRVFAQRSPQLLQLVPHKYLASYLHINPTNFSKLYNSMLL